MLEPEQTRAATAHAGAPMPPAAAASPHALQILNTEHWSLLSSRSMGYTEAMSRVGHFIAALSGAVVALALVAQAADFGDGFVAFALVLLPVVFFVGMVTVARLGQINAEDAVWVQGMNRVRHAYLELAPELEPYFVTGRYDDAAGVLASAPRSKPRTPIQVLVSAPSLVAVLDSVVAGATAGIAAYGLDAGTAASLAAGVVVFVASLASFVAYGVRSIAFYRSTLDVRFPTPTDPQADSP